MTRETRQCTFYVLYLLCSYIWYTCIVFSRKLRDFTRTQTQQWKFRSVFNSKALLSVQNNVEIGSSFIFWIDSKGVVAKNLNRRFSDWITRKSSLLVRSNYMYIIFCVFWECRKSLEPYAFCILQFCVPYSIFPYSFYILRHSIFLISNRQMHFFARATVASVVVAILLNALKLGTIEHSVMISFKLLVRDVGSCRCFQFSSIITYILVNVIHTSTAIMVAI